MTDHRACNRIFAGGASVLLMLFTASSLAFAGPGEAGRGKAIATGAGASGTTACSGCHGAMGEGLPGSGAPRLAGLDGTYLRHQLAAFAAGTRENAVMGPIAGGLDPTAMADVAAYYADLPAPVAGAPGRPGDAMSKEGRTLAERGDWSAQIPACGACHGPRGLGVGGVVPAIAGQAASYLAGQLRAWKARTRRDDPMGLMGTVAERLDEQQIAAVAAYYASLPARDAFPTAGERTVP